MRFWSSEYPLHQAPSLRCRGGTVEEREHNFNTLDHRTAPISNSAASATTTEARAAGNIGIGTTSAATEKLEVNGKVKADDLKVGSGTQLIASLLDAIMPIGSIIPWHKNIKKPDGTEAALTLPAGWIECNGDGTATINDTASPLHGYLIPNLNTEGRFLRGSIASGVKQDSQNLLHTHEVFMQVSRDGISNYYFNIMANGDPVASIGGYWALNVNSWVGGKLPDYAAGAQSRSLINSAVGGSESRPVNMSVVYIMRIK